MSFRPRSLVAVALACTLAAGPAGATAGAVVPARAAPAGDPAARRANPSLAAPSPSVRERASYTRAWIALGLGAALTAISFAFAHSADQAYADYRASVDPATLGADYDRAVRNDRWASATLLAGQAGLALGVYWRLVSRPHARPETPEVHGEVGPARGQALALRLRPAPSGCGGQLGLVLEF